MSKPKRKAKGKRKAKAPRPAVVAKVGRPSDYTPELADRICSLLAEGISLRKVCKADDMPDASTVFRWIRTNEEFRQQYARAKEESADADVEEIKDIADEKPRLVLNNAGDQVVDNGFENYRKTRIDVRKWSASKLKPKKYGDKVTNELTGKDGAALPAPVFQVLVASEDG